MDILIAAGEPFVALSLEAMLDLGGHKILGPAATAAMWRARCVKGLGCPPSSSGRLPTMRTQAKRPLGAWLARPAAPAWSSGLRGSPRHSGRVDGCEGRLPGQIELFHRPERPKPSDIVTAKRTLGGRS